jgi:hypothetical protein
MVVIHMADLTTEDLTMEDILDLITEDILDLIMEDLILMEGLTMEDTHTMVACLESLEAKELEDL